MTYTVHGRFKDTPIYPVLCDLFGLEYESVDQRDQNVLQRIAELISEKIGSSDEIKILKTVRKYMHEVSGENKHRAIYRILQLSQKPKKESTKSRWPGGNEE